MVEIFHLIVAMVVQAEPISMQHPLTTQLEIILAILKNKLVLSEHIICGQLELEEMLKNPSIVFKEIINERQRLFYQIKWPDHHFYQGGWGPEILRVPKKEDILVGRPAIIHATEPRAEQVRLWIIENLYPQ